VDVAKKTETKKASAAQLKSVATSDNGANPTPKESSKEISEVDSSNSLIKIGGEENSEHSEGD